MSGRIRLDMAYDGAGFHGWAAQPGLRTVQGELAAALERIVRRPVPLTVAGRTDAGVHARGQVAHLDLTEAELVRVAGRAASATEALARRLNAILADDLRVLDARAVGDGFDARFSALWRRYRYRIADQRSAQDPLTRGFIWWTVALENGAMAASVAPLLGEHDFAPFCLPREGASTVRRLLALTVDRVGPGRIDITVQADAFCHHMVRFLVGALADVGAGRRDPAWPGEVLASGVRPAEVRLAPSHGLTLEAVAYPEGDQTVLEQAERARVRRLPNGDL
ncbi:MAG: tRNA pseudouridine(38-40) synthase TruA [Bifidobacteriaceae bacterium]|jgi:tRNA pseudouridine38-40 synthase|nr:tRNA pseudouridine(38-40) synthase TruA [Bifidobacteriaceae bacterium]